MSASVSAGRVVCFDTGELREGEMAIVGPRGRTPLTRTEAELLFYLLGRDGAVVGQRELLTQVWGYNRQVESRTVYATINRLRTKLELNPAEPRHLLAVRGFGYRLVAARLEGPRPDTNVEAPPPCWLPDDPSPLFGREEALIAVRRALSAASLVTLTGTGGIGKTRLAVRAARDALADYPGGAWFCDLSAAWDMGDVLTAMAASLGLTPGGDTRALLGGHLVGLGRALILLDNVEQAIGPVSALVDDWLARAPEIRFLATSREPLHLPLERVSPLDPLPVPNDGAALADVAASPAVALFAARCQEARASFRLDDHNTGDAADLVRALDGLPLAIELAAARSRVLSPKQMLDLLRRRFSLLVEANRPARHATLRDAIGWSWDLLDDEERSALAALAVFRGDFDLSAAEAVFGPELPFMLDLVQALVDRSLVRVIAAPELGGELRYGLYESIREYAAEQLAASGDRRPADRHTAWYAGLGSPEREAERRRSASGPRRLARDQQNLAVALERAIEAGDTRHAALAALALGEVASLAGPAEIVAPRLARVLALPGLDADHEVALLVRMLSLAWASTKVDVAATVARLDAAAGAAPGLQLAALLAREHLIVLRPEDEVRPAIEAALALARALGDGPREARALQALGYLDMQKMRYIEAIDMFERAIVLARSLDDHQLAATSLGRLAHCQERAIGPEAAIPTYEEALAFHRASGLRRSEGGVLGNLAGAHFVLGRLEEARRLVEAAIAVHRQSGNRRSEHVAWLNVARILYCQGKLEEGDRVLRDQTAGIRRLGVKTLYHDLLIQRGAFAAVLGRPAEARGLLDEALAFAVAEGNPMRAAGARLFLALVAADAGDWPGALGHLAASGESGPARHRSFFALMALGLAKSGDADGARAHLAAGAAQTMTFDPSDRFMAAWAESEALRALGEPVAAARVVAAAEALAVEVGVEDGPMLRRMRRR